MRLIRLFPGVLLGIGVLLGTLSGASIGLALVAADCTELRQFDGCGVFAVFSAFVLGIIGGVVSVPVFAIFAAKRWWAVYAMLMGILLGVFVGGVVGTSITEDLDNRPRHSSVAPYVGLLSGGVLGAATGALAYCYFRQRLGLLDEDWRRTRTNT